MADTLLKPGVETDVAGQYVQINSKGAVQNDGNEVTLAGGDTAPPTEKRGWVWMLVDASKHAGDAPAEEVVPGARPQPAAAAKPRLGAAQTLPSTKARR